MRFLLSIWLLLPSCQTNSNASRAMEGRPDNESLLEEAATTCLQPLDASFPSVSVFLSDFDSLRSSDVVRSYRSTLRFRGSKGTSSPEIQNEAKKVYPLLDVVGGSRQGEYSITHELTWKSAGLSNLKTFRFGDANEFFRFSNRGICTASSLRIVKVELKLPEALDLRSTEMALINVSYQLKGKDVSLDFELEPGGFLDEVVDGVFSTHLLAPVSNDATNFTATGRYFLSNAARPQIGSTIEAKLLGDQELLQIDLKL